jgi:uncharacterized protein (DUF3084 family)
MSLTLDELNVQLAAYQSQLQQSHTSIHQISGAIFATEQQIKAFNENVALAEKQAIDKENEEKLRLEGENNAAEEGNKSENDTI